MLKKAEWLRILNFPSAFSTDERSIQAKPVILPAGVNLLIHPEPILNLQTDGDKKQRRGR